MVELSDLSPPDFSGAQVRAEIRVPELEASVTDYGTVVEIEAGYCAVQLPSLRLYFGDCVRAADTLQHLTQL